jgi:hypothetical protein
MTLLMFVSSFVATPIAAIRHMLEIATQTLAEIERMIRTPDRDTQIEALKARIEHLESLLQPKSE